MERLREEMTPAALKGGEGRGKMKVCVRQSGRDERREVVVVFVQPPVLLYRAHMK